MKQYADASYYEKKLKAVMTRFEVEDFNYNWDRHGAWIEFRYNGELHRFDHSVENAINHGQDVKYGSDIFAQLVLALEDLARIVNRGIYDLGKWIAGMQFLPPPIEIPTFFQTLGFTSIPESAGEVKTRYRNLSQSLHPDKGGSNADFNNVKRAAELATRYFEEDL
jgi:hypothetical protein